jgi:hypothetical protein
VSAHVSEDRLIDLAAGLLPLNVSAPLLEHVRGCAECEDVFRRVCAEWERSRLRPAEAVASRRWFRPAVAIAAAVLGIAILIPFLRTKSVPDPRDYWVPIEEGTVDLRSAPQDENAAVFAEATEAYRRHDAEKVIELLDRRTIPASRDLLKIFLASALLKSGSAQASLDVLDALRINTLPQPYRDRAKWVRVGALRAAGRDTDATNLLGELAAYDGEFRDAARRMIPGN